MRIAYICTNCRKAHYSEETIRPVGNQLFVCKDEFKCKGRFLKIFGKKNIKDFILR